jgi:hypothetical protein
MDVAALAASLMAAQMGGTQLALATQMVKMGAQADASVVKLVESGQQNLNRLANLGAGIGGSLDISV